MYKVHVSCPTCGRKHSYDAKDGKPVNDRDVLCPFPHDAKKPLKKPRR